MMGRGGLDSFVRIRSITAIGHVTVTMHICIFCSMEPPVSSLLFNEQLMSTHPRLYINEITVCTLFYVTYLGHCYMKPCHEMTEHGKRGIMYRL